MYVILAAALMRCLLNFLNLLLRFLGLERLFHLPDCVMGEVEEWGLDHVVYLAVFFDTETELPRIEWLLSGRLLLF